MNFLIYAVILVLGIVIGSSFVIMVFYGAKRYGGVIVASQNDDNGLTYSLVLHQNPEELLKMKEIRFKIELSEEEANRG